MAKTPTSIDIPSLGVMFNLNPGKFGLPYDKAFLNATDKVKAVFIVVPSSPEAGEEEVPTINLNVEPFYRGSSMMSVLVQAHQHPEVLSALRRLCLETTGDVVALLVDEGVEPRQRQIVLEWLYPDGGLPEKS